LIERLVDAGTRPVPPTKDSFPDLDPAIAAVLDRALAFEKSARFAGAAEMQEAVRQCAQNGPWSAGPLGPALSVELPPLSAAIEGQPGRRAVTREPTLRIFRSRRASRTTSLVVGGAAMLVASIVSVRAPHPPAASLPALDSPVVVEAPPAPPPPPGAGQELITWKPLPAPRAAAVAHAGRRSKASKRPRATAVASDDDLWGRRH
jgi:serine/threonine-protein kinase